MLHVPGLYISESEGRGRGVFTAHEIDKGDLIEICPLIIIPPKEVQDIHKTILHDYYYLWPSPNGAACIVLGYGSIYNHDLEPNGEIIMDLQKKEFEIRCIRYIEAGDEIFVSYVGGEKDISALWFVPV